MRTSIVAALLLVACGGASSAPPPVRISANDVAVQPDEPEASPEPVALVRRHTADATYRNSIVIYLSDVIGLGQSFRYRFGGPLEVARRADGRFDAVQRFDEATMMLNDRVVSAQIDMDGLRRTASRYVVDERNRIDPHLVTTEGTTPQNALFVDEVFEAMRFVRVTLPPEAVVPGESWHGERFTWDTRPFGWVVVTVEPRFALVGVEERDGRRIARVRWDAAVRLEPFSAMGLDLEGEGTVHGFSDIDLSDGLTSNIDLDGTVGLRAVGTRPGAQPAMTVNLKLDQQITPLD